MALSFDGTTANSLHTRASVLSTTYGNDVATADQQRLYRQTEAASLNSQRQAISGENTDEELVEHAEIPARLRGRRQGDYNCEYHARFADGVYPMKISTSQIYDNLIQGVQKQMKIQADGNAQTVVQAAYGQFNNMQALSLTNYLK